MKLSSLAAAGAIALTAAGASFAQPMQAPGAPAGDAQGWRRPDPAQMAERHAERLRAILQLRPDQEPALRAFIAAMQPTPEQLQRREAERAQRGEARNLPTPERLDHMQARLAERQAAFARRSDAVKRFHAQLSPAQQKAFDALPMPHGGMRGPEHGGPEHGGFGRGGFEHGGRGGPDFG
jgi:hypothetical protein